MAKLKWIELPFAHVPTVAELLEMSKDNSIKGYYARLSLERKARGYEIPATVTYPVQTWTFGDKLAMINLAGEVVVDYAVRLKNELGADRVWINAYSNDVPSYIASKRILKEGGYEAETSMYWYDKPSPFSEDVEDMIVEAVKSILPQSYKRERATTNTARLVTPGENGVLHLRAESARTTGPKIAYMPEWEAFGWFTEADRVEWDIDVDKKGKYDVYLDWSVSDDMAGKSFVFEAGKRKVTGKVGETGSWFTYRKEKIGTVQLSEGTQKVVFKPGSETENGALMDLREITLVPAR
jgi:neutral ceramidase